jgi:hypothetical protein
MKLRRRSPSQQFFGHETTQQQIPFISLDLVETCVTRGENVSSLKIYVLVLYRTSTRNIFLLW